MKTLLVLDVHYLCYRAYHTMGRLSHKDISTGVIYGFLKGITPLKDEFMTDDVVFCFEHRKNYRTDIYPSYKARRHKGEKTEEEKAAAKELAIQIHELRMRYLPQIGFNNVFSFCGMESDDIMARIALDNKDRCRIVLVTADNDLLQCLDENVQMYSPQKQKVFTDKWFRNHYGIEPRQWAVVKAIAGCTSDEVEGIKGVGELTALKYLRRELKPESAAFKKIMSPEGKRIVRRNRELVELPFKSCPPAILQDDEINRRGWEEVCATLGMKSIAGRLPIQTRKRAEHERRDKPRQQRTD